CDSQAWWRGGSRHLPRSPTADAAKRRSLSTGSACHVDSRAAIGVARTSAARRSGKSARGATMKIEERMPATRMIVDPDDIEPAIRAVLVRTLKKRAQGP